MDFTKLKRVRSVTVAMLGEDVRLDYVRMRWNNAFVERHNALVAEEDESLGPIEQGRKRYLYTLLMMLDGWDVTVDGQAAEITEGLLDQMDTVWLYVMYQAIRDDLAKESEEKN